MAKCFSIGMLLCSAVICNSINACHVPACTFNPTHSEHWKVMTEIGSGPHHDLWQSDQLDQVDRFLFEHGAPYAFQSIQQSVQFYCDITKSAYDAAFARANQNIEEKQKNIEQKSTNNYLNSTKVNAQSDRFKELCREQQLFQGVKLRLQEYKKILNDMSSDPYEQRKVHNCAEGYNIGNRAILCAIQWTVTQHS